MSALVSMSRRRRGALAPAPAAEVAERTGSVPVAHNGTIEISRAQRNIHVVTEAAAVFAVTPFLVYLALDDSNELEDWQRGALGAIAVGTLVVDGGLLIRWMRERRRAKNGRS